MPECDSVEFCSIFAWTLYLEDSEYLLNNVMSTSVNNVKMFITSMCIFLSTAWFHMGERLMQLLCVLF